MNVSVDVLSRIIWRRQRRLSAALNQLTKEVIALSVTENQFDAQLTTLSGLVNQLIAWAQSQPGYSTEDAEVNSMISAIQAALPPPSTPTETPVTEAPAEAVAETGLSDSSPDGVPPTPPATTAASPPAGSAAPGASVTGG